MVWTQDDRRQSRDDEALWKIEDVAAYVGKHPETIRRWVRQGRIPFYRLGRGWRFIPSEVREWVSQQPGRPEQPAA
jgi:excisionase family DNA binding protein